MSDIGSLLDNKISFLYFHKLTSISFYSLALSRRTVEFRYTLMTKQMQDTVMLGADFYETDAEVTALLAEGRVPVGIGENTRIRYVTSLNLKK